MPNFKNTQKPETRNQKPEYAPDTLLSTEQIIEFAKKNGVDFGPGDAAERIRYFIKLGILPHAVRKSKKDENNQSISPPVGHFHGWTVDRLRLADKLYKKGASYPAIAQKIKKIEARENTTFKNAVNFDDQTAPVIPQESKPIANTRPAINLFPRMGLSEKEIERRFKQHEVKVRNLVEEELKLAVTKPTFTPSPNRFLQTARIFLLLTIVAGLSMAVFYAGSKLTCVKD